METENKYRMSTIGIEENGIYIVLGIRDDGIIHLLHFSSIPFCEDDLDTEDIREGFPHLVLRADSQDPPHVLSTKSEMFTIHITEGSVLSRLLKARTSALSFHLRTTHASISMASSRHLTGRLSMALSQMRSSILMPMMRRDTSSRRAMRRSMRMEGSLRMRSPSDTMATTL